jgi:hypothetical protein
MGQILDIPKNGPGICGKIDNLTNELPSLRMGIDIWYPLINKIEDEVNDYCKAKENKSQGEKSGPKEGQSTRNKDEIVKMLDVIPRILRYSVCWGYGPIKRVFPYNYIESQDIDVSLASLRVIYHIYSGFENIGPPLLPKKQPFSDDNLSFFTGLARGGTLQDV